MNIESMRRSCAIFKKLKGFSFDITRPEVESLWTVFVEVVPTEKQIKQLKRLFWHYDADTQTFSQYF